MFISLVSHDKYSATVQRDRGKDGIPEVGYGEGTVYIMHVMHNIDIPEEYHNIREPRGLHVPSGLSIQGSLQIETQEMRNVDRGGDVDRGAEMLSC